MNFDRENTVYKTQCLSHDVVDIFHMMSDCALEPKNFNSANVGMEKVESSYNLKKMNGEVGFGETVLKNVFGGEGLGNPLWGNPANFHHLEAYYL